MDTLNPSLADWLESLDLPDCLFKESFIDMFLVSTIPRIRPGWTEEWGPRPPMLTPYPPLHFQDRHIPEGLALRKVVYAPLLLHDMKREFRQTFERYLATHGTPKPGSSSDPFPTLTGMSDRILAPCIVFKLYKYNIGEPNLEYSSRLHVTPGAKMWRTSFNFSPRDKRSPFCFEAHVCINPDATGRQKPNFGNNSVATKKIDPAICTQLAALRKKGVGLAALTFYPPGVEGEWMVDNFVDRSFKWTIALTDGGGTVNVNHEAAQPKFQDSHPAFWSQYLLPSVSPSAQPPTPPSLRPPHQKQNIWIPTTSGNRTSIQEPNLHHFIQRAWIAAVEKDCTFLLITCGTKERIGIRNRSTNTLLLSDVVDPFDDEYGLIQMAFHSAMVQDALNRKPIPVSSLNQQNLATKKPVLKSLGVHVDFKMFDEEMARRPVVLLSFNMGVYRSPSPSAFLRKRSSCTPLPYSDTFRQQVGGSSCDINDCVTLEITRLVGSGGQGLTYRGMARLPTDTGDVLESPLIIKVVHSVLDTHYLEHEYEVYRALAMNNISEGIVKVYGLFEDPEAGDILLVMRDGGKPFVDGQVKLLSDSQFQFLIKTIQAINAADISHNDIKCDNILMDSNGTLSIIDFGNSRFTSRSELLTSFDDDRDDDPIEVNPPPHKLKLVEEESAKAAHSHDVQSIEDIYLGRHYAGRRYLDWC